MKMPNPWTYVVHLEPLKGVTFRQLGRSRA